MKKRHSEHGPVTVHGRRFATLRGPNGWAQAIGDVRADAIARGSTLGYVTITRSLQVGGLKRHPVIALALCWPWP
jgi:hypothetical protein